MFLESHTGPSTIQITSESVADGALPRLAKPFLKWVGGKTQLIEQLDLNAPVGLKDGSLERYIEPFVGGGSFFFHVAQKYSVDRLVIADSNRDLILAYWTIRDRVGALILTLQDIQAKYLSLSEKQREDYYYATRKLFNENKMLIDMESFSDDWIERTAQLIFLNKTCFNGLFRVNAAGLFNVAFGKYVNPKICDPSNLVAVAQILERTEILLGDFSSVLPLVNANSFVYLDPPYRPLSVTSNFTGYSSNSFTDADQTRLAEFCRDATMIGAKLMISNSDPENIGSDDTYYQDTYPGYSITRAYANRMVNCKADRRGKITELIITNYSLDDTRSVQGSVTQETLSQETLSLKSASDYISETDQVDAPISAAKTEPVEEPAQMQMETLMAAKTALTPKAVVAAKTPDRRSGAALGAFKLLSEYAEKEKAFELGELCIATGWKEQTARTYVSKKWKDYLESVDGPKSKLLKVKKAFLKHTEESFLAEFSQVGSAQGLKPQTVDEAKTMARSALLAYADFLAASDQAAEETRIRTLAEQL
jgi:DNA adenine methylase